MKPSTRAIRFVESLRIPTGPLAGKPVRLAPFQRQFIKGAYGDDTELAVLSVGRGGAKSALSGAIGLGELLGETDSQPGREILIGARNRDQAKIAWTYAMLWSRSLPEEIQKRLKFRVAPRLEIEFDGDHLLRVVPADGKSVLGTSPTFAILDERGHWELDKGNALEDAVLSGLGKRGGRCLIVSTSAPDDAHPLSQWIDNPPPGTYAQEHRPSPSLPVDDVPSLYLANPGARHGIGYSLDRLLRDACRAIARGGSALTSFRLYNRNERVSAETRDSLLTVDEWLACETSELPPRSGQVVVGIDLGGSASMSAVAYYWPDSGRLEAFGTFPSKPSLADRGQRDGVSGRYVEMQDRGELDTLGDQTVPVAPWLVEVMRRIEGEVVACLCADRYKQSELGEAIEKAGIRVPVIWRGQGFRDGGEDCERFRRAAYDGKVRSAPSLLMRSAMADAVCLRDPANNLKLAKARSLGRIDPVAAAVLAVAEGARMVGRAPVRGGRWAWG